MRETTQKVTDVNHGVESSVVRMVFQSRVEHAVRTVMLDNDMVLLCIRMLYLPTDNTS